MAQQMQTKLGSELEYEDLLGLWSDLESGLAVLLKWPSQAVEFAQRVADYDRWLQDLLHQDVDLGLYLLFQLATHSRVGYSASHALMCAVLCHLLATELALPEPHRDSLVRAALTMNIAMTGLQDQLANQSGDPSAAEKLVIRDHPGQAVILLNRLGVSQVLWLEAIHLHHRDPTVLSEADRLSPAQQLARILALVDRYAARVSPRQSREGRDASEAAKNMLSQHHGSDEFIAQALLKVVGLYPPGTLVKLEDGSLALVRRRAAQPALPEVAIIARATGQPLKPPILQQTGDGGSRIACALAAHLLGQRVSHHVVLSLQASH